MPLDIALTLDIIRCCNSRKADPFQCPRLIDYSHTDLPHSSPGLLIGSKVRSCAACGVDGVACSATDCGDRDRFQPRRWRWQRHPVARIRETSLRHSGCWGRSIDADGAYHSNQVSQHNSDSTSRKEGPAPLYELRDGAPWRTLIRLSSKTSDDQAGELMVVWVCTGVRAF